MNPGDNDPLGAMLRQTIQQSDTAQQSRVALGFGMKFDPDERAKAQRAAAQMGTSPDFARDKRSNFERAGKLNAIDFDRFVGDTPRLAQWTSNPENAAIAHDDLERLASMEATSTAANLYNLSPAQRAAVVEERKRVILHNYTRNEVNSALANTDQAFYSPVLDLLKSAAHWAGAAAGTASELGNFVTGPQTLNQTAENIAGQWRNPQGQGTLAGAVGDLTDSGKRFMGGYVKHGPSQSLVDPSTGKPFENPDYAWWGRPLVNTAEALPGTIAAFGVAGKAGPGVFALNAGTEKYRQAISEGANPFTAGAEALGSAGLNMALMTKLPPSVPTHTIPGAVVQAAGRGTALGLGMTAGENALSMLHGSTPSLFQGAGQNILSMIGFELAPVGARIFDAAAESRLRQRAPEKFGELTQAILKDTAMEDALVPVEAFTTYFQSKGIDPRVAAEDLGAKNFEEARAAGTDLVIPTAQLAAKIAGGEHAGLLEDVRFRPGHLSIRELRDLPPEAQAAAEDALKAQAGQVDEQARVQAAQQDLANLPSPELMQVKADIKARLVAVGMEPSTAETNATLYAARMATAAQREGLNPAELHAMYAPVISGPAGEAPANLADMIAQRLEAPLLQGPSGETFRAARPAEGGTETRGFIQVGEGRQFNIALLAGRDLSTFTHETGHLWLEMMSDLAARESASPQIREDFQKVLKFLGVDAWEKVGTKQHEKFARANEAYLMEGKAPSEALHGVFQRVKAWMQLIYQKAANLGVSLNEDVRGVFDRMYATDQEIETARQHLGGSKLFTKAEDMGVSQAEFALYDKAYATQDQTAQNILQAKFMKELQRERTSQWRKELGQVRDEVTKNIDARPEYQAIKALRRGTTDDGVVLSLNRQSLVEQFGEDRVRALHDQHPNVYRVGGGMDAEAAALVLGFDSGQALMEALEGAPKRNEAIRSTSDAIMKERHGDMRLDGTMADAAMEALHNQKREDVLAMELRGLRKKQREVRPFVDLALKDRARAERFWARGLQSEIPPMQSFREAARDLVAKTAIKDLTPDRYIIASRQASREVLRTFGRGEYGAAGDAKEKEILNHFLYLEAVKAKARAETIYRYQAKFDRPSVRANFGKAGGPFLEQTNAIRDRYEFARITNKELATRQTSLADFVEAQRKEGEELVIDPSVLNEARRINYREATITELEAVHEALRNIETVARRQLESIINGVRVTREDQTAALVNAAYTNGKAKEIPFSGSDLSVIERLAKAERSFSSVQLRPEQVLEQLDGGNIKGPWSTFVFNRIAEAQTAAYDLTQKVSRPILDALESMPKEMRLKGTDPVGIRLPGMDRDLIRRQVLSMAFNWGNQEQRTKLINGYGWNLELDKVDAALRTLTSHDWALVQKTWDTLDALRPALGELERRMTGLEPKWVEASPFTITTSDGVEMHLKGGYFPVKYDSTRDTHGAMQDTNILELTDRGFLAPNTPNGFTKERTKYAGPILLDFESILTKHLAQVIHRVTHQEALSDIWKLFKQDQVRKAVMETRGEEYMSVLDNWLRHVANDRNGSPADALSWWNRAAFTSRSNVVIGTLCFRAASVLAQVTDFVRVAASPRVDGVYLADGIREFTSSIRPGGNLLVEKVQALSGEMRSRSENLDRDMRKQAQLLAGKSSNWAEIQRFGMYGLAMADTITSYPTWWSVYRKGIDTHGQEGQAVQEADRAVRLLLSADAPKDQPAVKYKTNGIAPFMTMYMGDATPVYGWIRDSIHRASGAKDIPKVAAALVFGAMLPAILYDLLKNRGPRPGENKVKWALQRAAFSLPGTMVFFRDVAGVIEAGLEGRQVDYKFSPVVSTVDKAAKTFVMGGKVLSGDKNHDLADLGIDALGSFGVLAGVGGSGQAATAAQYLNQVRKGQVKPKGALDVASGLTFGPPPKSKKK